MAQAGIPVGADQWATFGSVQANNIGAVAGVELGYDWQSRYFVYGVVGDWTWTSMKKTVTGGSGSTSYETKINWLASARAPGDIQPPKSLPEIPNNPAPPPTSVAAIPFFSYGGP